MTERDALITAIAAHPDEDTPRLVFADWLQEHGDEPRAELIRLECARARRGHVWPDPEKERAVHLIANNWQEWFAELFAALGMPEPGPAVPPTEDRGLWRYGRYAMYCPGQLPEWMRVWSAEEADAQTSGEPPWDPPAQFLYLLQFDRGLVTGLTAALEHRPPDCSLAAALRLEPIRALHLTFAEDPSTWDGQSDPILRRLDRLGLSYPDLGSGNPDYSATAATILNDPALTGVRTLWFSGYDRADGGQGFDGLDRWDAPVPLVEAAVRSAVAGAVTRLTLGVGPEGVRAFDRAAPLPGLRALDLSSNGLDRTQADATVRLHRYRDRIEELNLSHNRTNVAMLASGPPWSQLTTLNLAYNGIATPECALLSDPVVFPVLARLDLSDNWSMREGGVATLAGVLRAGRFPRLTHLSLSYCGLDDALALGLAREVVPTGIRVLDLTRNDSITDAAKDDIRALLGTRVELTPPPLRTDGIPF